MDSGFPDSKVKPICLVYVVFPDRNVSRDRSEFQAQLDRRFDDYHVLVIPAFQSQEKLIEMEVFYDGDFTSIRFDELRAVVEDKLKTLTNESTKSKQEG